MDMDDDFFDDFDWEDAVVVGSFVDFMTEEEAEDERRRRKLEGEMSTNPDDCDDCDEHDEDDCL